MRSKSWACGAVGGALLLGAGIARAQEATEAPIPPPPILMLQAGIPDEGRPPEAFGERIELLGFGGLHGGKVVKNVPFSATATSESTQTLADGTHISRKTQTALYRDSQGRFRKEVTMPSIGLLAAPGQLHSFVVISDPVVGVEYVLEPDQKVARKMPGFPGGGKKAGKPFEKGALGYRAWKGNAEEGVQKESLGTQKINGVNAEGTRYTRTIAAGQIGNDKAISIVSERWYSPDLQLVVMSKHSDPRFGDTTYTLTNIQRQEPAAALFDVPSDYTVEEGRPRGHTRGFRGGPPPDMLAPPPPGN